MRPRTVIEIKNNDMIMRNNLNLGQIVIEVNTFPACPSHQSMLYKQQPNLSKYISPCGVATATAPFTTQYNSKMTK